MRANGFFGVRSPARSDETLIFLHLPKTAGMSLKSIIRRQYPDDQICDLYKVEARDAVDEFAAMPAERRARFRAIAGHMQFGIHRFVPGDWCYVSIFRDPVEICISAYHYVLRQPNHPRHKLIADKDLATVMREGLLPYLDNGQTRTLCSTEVQNVPYGECTEQMLEQAKLNVARYIEIAGTPKYFDETVLMLKDRLGWKNVFYRPRNVTRARPRADQLPGSTREIIRAHNRLDDALHRFVNERIEGRMDQAGRSFARRLKWFRSSNALVSKLSQIRARA